MYAEDYKEKLGYLPYSDKTPKNIQNFSYSESTSYEIN